MAMTLAGHLTHRESRTESEGRRINPVILGAGITSWSLVALRVVFAVAG